MMKTEEITDIFELKSRAYELADTLDEKASALMRKSCANQEIAETRGEIYRALLHAYETLMNVSHSIY